MPVKLALRNVKRQTLSYIIYFITVAFTVALMYAVNNILLSEELRDFGTYTDSATEVLTAMIAIVTLVMGFIIGYATVFLLRKRKKEFGVYMLLGIPRHKTVLMFFIEHLMISALSFAIGVLLGLGVFQIFNGIICGLMGHGFPPLGYTAGSFRLTFIQWAAIFLATTAYSAFALYRTRISDMLSEKETAYKTNKLKKLADGTLFLIFGAAIALLVIYEISLYARFSASWDSSFFQMEVIAGLPLGLLGIAACVLLIPKPKLTERMLSFVMLGIILAASCVLVLLQLENGNAFDREVELIDVENYWYFMALSAIMLLCAIFLFYYFTRSFYSKRLELRKNRVKPVVPEVVYGLPENETPAPFAESGATDCRPTAKLRGANVFHYRQMSSSLKSNAVMISIIGLLLSVSLFFTNFAFSNRADELQGLYKSYPFNLEATWTQSELEPYWKKSVSIEETVAALEKYAEITFMHTLPLYYTQRSDIETRPESEGNYCFVLQSDANIVLEKIGAPQLTLGSGQYYSLEPYRYNGYGDPAVTEPVGIFGNTFVCKGVLDFSPYAKLFSGGVFEAHARVVVPDDIVLPESADDYVLSKSIFINTKNPIPPDFYKTFENVYTFCRDQKIDDLNANSSFFITAALFLSIAFMFISMALISLKVTASADLDKKRYAILSRLGVSADQQKRMIFRQIFGFFMIPMIIPLFMAGVSTAFCAALSYVNAGIISLSVYTVGIMTVLAYMGIYLAYLTAAFYLSVQTGVMRAEKPKLQIFGKGGGEEHVG